MEAELEEERKQRTAAISARKKVEGDLKDIEQQLEHVNKVKEDALRQLKKLQVSCDFSHCQYCRHLEMAKICILI